MDWNTTQNPSKLQKIKSRVQQRIDDKINEPYDTTRNKGYWWRALKHGKVNFNDSTMGYPKFVMFCYKTYIWGDRAFNSYDSTYVKATGTIHASRDTKQAVLLSRLTLGTIAPTHYPPQQHCWEWPAQCSWESVGACSTLWPLLP